MNIKLVIQGRTFTATFVKSEDAGYQAGKLILDMPYGNSEHISVYKSGRKWVEAYVQNGACRRSKTHGTRLAALTSAAKEYAGCVLDSEQYVA